MLRRSHPARAFTLVEMLAVLFLSTLLSLVVAMALEQSAKSTSVALGRSQAQQRADTAIEQLTKAVRGAKPPEVCLSDDTATTPSSCARLGEQGSAFLTATTDQIDFYAYDTGSANGATAVASAPDVVQVYIDTNNILWVNRFAADPTTTAITASVGNGSYRGYDADPSIAKPTVATEIGKITPGGGPLFSFFDTSGTQLRFVTAGSVSGWQDTACGDVVGGCAPDPARLAIIEIHPTLTSDRGDALEPVDEFVQVPSVALAGVSS